MHSAGPRRGLARIKPRLYYSPSPSDAGAGAAECESRAAKEAGGVCGDGRAALCAPGGDGGLPRGPAVHLQRAGTGGHGAGPSLREALALRGGERQTRPAGQGRACVRRTHRARASDSARRRRPCGPGPGLRGPLVCRAPVSLRPAPPLPWDSCAAHAALRESRAEGAEEGNPR